MTDQPPLPEIVDTHCHLTSGELGGRVDDVAAAAAKAGVTRLVNVSCVPGEWDAALELRRRFAEQMWLAAGIHPHEAAQATEADFARLTDIWRQPGVVGCGEMGLDYHYDFSPRLEQRAVFARQLSIARELDLPIIVHCREAHADTTRILRDHGFANRRVVFHCFSGTCAEAKEIWSEGWWTSFTGTITFKKSTEQQQACAAADDDALMFETDSPYLTPEPVRRIRPNEPRYLPHTIRFAARLRKQEPAELAARSTANAMRFFGLSNNG